MKTMTHKLHTLYVTVALVLSGFLRSLVQIIKTKSMLWNTA